MEGSVSDLLGNGAGTGGSFPQGGNAMVPTGSKPNDLVTQAAQNLINTVGDNAAKSIATMTQAQFLDSYNHYGVTSSNINLFVNSDGHPNANGLQLAWYVSLPQSERQVVQEAMATLGLITPAQATGDLSNSPNGAFIGVLGQSTALGVSADSYLNELGGGTAAIQNQISQNLTAAQKAATQPITVSNTNPTTLNADLTTAFDQDLGYAPSAAQEQSFSQQVQGQETNYAEAPRQEAQQQVAQAQQEENALANIGPDGIDLITRAYAAAVSGTKLPGAGTTQGPSIGTATAPGNADQGPYLPGRNPNAYVQQDGPPYQGRVPTTMVPPTKNANGTITPAPGSQLAGALGNAYGGLYALNNADWAEAQKLVPSAKSFKTPGAAPESVQTSAFQALFQNAYEQNGGNSEQAIMSIAQGTPLGTTQGTHMSNLAQNITQEVNNQISNVQNEVNNSAVTVKVTQPDAAAEAQLAAKSADPAGYYAANYAAGSDLLSQILSGAFRAYDYSTSDTFSGPVQPAAAAAASSTPTQAA